MQDTMLAAPNKSRAGHAGSIEEEFFPYFARFCTIFRPPRHYCR
jgi:hypothetical protein